MYRFIHIQCIYMYISCYWSENVNWWWYIKASIYVRCRFLMLNKNKEQLLSYIETKYQHIYMYSIKNFDFFFLKLHFFRKINAFFLITCSCQPWKTSMTSCTLCMRRPRRRFETSVVNRSLELCDTITCPPPCSVSPQTRWPRNSRAHYGVNVIIHQATHQQRGSKIPSPSNRIRGVN